ncbi:FecCD family ABC transporter permease [Calderihabitans maritimus]|uniref:ABC transporter, permease protein n=1 Tax=Calderihabitans maritimus TaxID=1246530 RepID=A0A1Z5HRR5_9FIRM|nr:iron ABC transporter permease [Calderihabitans maritimus]GAW92204.1 ABC transporter, permease protein [Calderihabitans maritimus]
MATEVKEIEVPAIKELYTKFTARKVVFILGSLGALVALSLYATTLGSARLGIGEVSSAVFARIFPFAGIETTSFADVVVWHLRLPRIVMGIVAGAGLAVSGAAMQGIMRNPLVSPFTIGVSSGAALGASLAIVLGFNLVGGEKAIVVTNAFVFGLLTAFLVYGLARMRGVTGETLILAGIAIMYLASAATSLLQYIATEEELQAVVYWLFGSLTGASWGNILIVTVMLFSCLPLLMRYSWDLNVMASGGDEVATSLGVNVPRVRVVTLILATLITAGIICFTGIIGFVCLVAPHITRLLIGADHRFLMPCSCILGAILLVGADTIGRTVFSPVVIPVGIVLSFIGVPFFIFLLMTRRKEYFS